MKSLQQRLGLGLAFLLIVVGVLFAQASLWLFDRSLRGYWQSDLQDDAHALLSAIVRGPAGLQLDHSRLEASYQRPFSGHYFEIRIGQELWRSRSLWDSDLALPSLAGLAAELESGPQDQQLLVYRGDYQRLGQSIQIVVGRDYTPILHSYRRMLWLGLGLGLLALVVILLAQRFTVRLALRPLERARLQISELQQGQRRQLDTLVPQELEALVGQINRLLQHTEDTLKRSRSAVGNLGHALKTPLAVLASLAQRPELSAQPELQTGINEQLEQIRQRLERELNRARLAGEVLPGSYFNCAEQLPALFATLQMIHSQHLSLRWQAHPALSLPYDREDILELLGNLLDNACKWAISCVQLSISEQEDGYRIMVQDDGPGIEPSAHEEVLKRGMRLDEQVAGHGLGLAIVQDMLAAWQGRLSLEASDLGGLCVVVDLPLRGLHASGKTAQV